MEKGNFPRSFEVTGRTVAWVEAEVDAWIASRIAERDVTKNHDRSKRTRKATEARKAMSSPMTPALRGSRGICARGSPTRSQMFQIRNIWLIARISKRVRAMLSPACTILYSMGRG